MATPLVTLEEYKTFAQISSNQQDDRITQLIPMVSFFVKNYCNRKFVDYYNTAKTEYWSEGGPYFFTDEQPIREVTSVEIKTSPSGDYVLATENVDYSWDRAVDCITALNTDGFPVIPNAVKIIYKGGYSDIPEDLKLGVMDLITYYMKGESSPRKSLNSNQISVEYVTSADLPHHIKRVFDLYRIIV
jgi:hypothetical protein